MNTVAEPIELLEAECSALSWYEDPVAAPAVAPVAAPEPRPPQLDDEADGYLSLDPACSERVLGWTVERICLAPSWCREPNI